MPVGPEMALRIEHLMRRELEIIDRERPGPIAHTLMLSQGGLNREHKQAMARIRDGIQSKRSVDEFIDEWQDVPHLAAISKLAIAHIILEAERESVLGEIAKGHPPAAQLRRISTSWLSVVAGRLNPEERRRDIFNVFRDTAFITFNYDRCIEYYLLTYFHNTHAYSEAEANRALASIPIFHVYGSLGDIQLGPRDQVSFGSVATQLNRPAAGIKTFTEEMDSVSGAVMQAVARNASKLIFLGCAFHDQNLRALFPSGTGAAVVWGTTYKMRPRRVEQVKSFFVGNDTRLEEFQCAEFLDRHDEEIFED